MRLYALIKRNKRSKQQWRAILVAKNGETVAVTENRSSRAGLVKMLQSCFSQFEIHDEK